MFKVQTHPLLSSAQVEVNQQLVFRLNVPFLSCFHNVRYLRPQQVAEGGGCGNGVQPVIRDGILQTREMGGVQGGCRIV